ncbi:MAG: hypothetical protein ACK4XK_14185 [Casimicrobiaceae bacterium]
MQKTIIDRSHRAASFEQILLEHGMHPDRFAPFNIKPAMFDENDNGIWIQLGRNDTARG